MAWPMKEKERKKNKRAATCEDLEGSVNFIPGAVGEPLEEVEWMEPC